MTFKNDNTKKANKGIQAFNTIYIIGIIFAFGKLIDYLRWTFQLVKEWSLPDEPFFSKVNLINSDFQISITAYLIFAIFYIIVFGFIILGLYQLNKTRKLFAVRKFFQREVSVSFNKAAKSFLAFVFGTFLIDIVLLKWATTSSRLIDLMSTELLVFLILGYMMFFLADILKEGINIKDAKELTN